MRFYPRRPHHGSFSQKLSVACKVEGLAGIARPADPSSPGRGTSSKEHQRAVRSFGREAVSGEPSVPEHGPPDRVISDLAVLLAVGLSRPDVDGEQSGYSGTNFASAIAMFQVVGCVRVVTDQLVANYYLVWGQGAASLRCPLGLIVREPLVSHVSRRYRLYWRDLSGSCCAWFMPLNWGDDTSLGGGCGGWGAGEFGCRRLGWRGARVRRCG